MASRHLSETDMISPDGSRQLESCRQWRRPARYGAGRNARVESAISRQILLLEEGLTENILRIGPSAHTARASARPASHRVSATSKDGHVIGDSQPVLSGPFDSRRHDGACMCFRCVAESAPAFARRGKAHTGPSQRLLQKYGAARRSRVITLPVKRAGVVTGQR